MLSYFQNFTNFAASVWDGSTPLHVAVYVYNDLLKVKQAYEANPDDLNVINYSGHTPLDNAKLTFLRSSNPEIVDYLISKGGLTATDVRGRLAISRPRTNSAPKPTHSLQTSAKSSEQTSSVQPPTSAGHTPTPL